jgi:hypothetical protein
VDEYRAITAYVLQFNGAAAGDQELTPSTLAEIGSLTKAGATPCCASAAVDFNNYT